MMWIQQQCTFIEENHTEGKEQEAYRLVKQLTGSFQGSSVKMVKDTQGTLLTKQEDILKRWTEYGMSLYTDNRACDTEVIKCLEARHDAEYVEDGSNIAREEIEEAVRKLKDKKSPGIDGIPAELIKKTGGPALITEIHRLCNMIWQEEEWPEQWTKSILATIPKKGDLTDCANYRTIALITHLSKILLLVILERLTAILEECLSEEQADPYTSIDF